MQLTIIKEVIWLLDQAQERRALSNEEEGFRSRLKKIYLGLVTVEKIKVRQRSRMTNIKYGEANTKFFFLKANRRKRKNTSNLCMYSKGWLSATKTKPKR
jgi:hypothetical protein